MPLYMVSLRWWRPGQVKAISQVVPHQWVLMKAVALMGTTLEPPWKELMSLGELLLKASIKIRFY